MMSRTKTLVCKRKRVVGWVGNVVQSAPPVRYSIPYLGKSYGSCVRDVTLVPICQVSAFDKELPRQLLKYIGSAQVIKPRHTWDQ
jgi:hypothetical protein